MSLLQKIAAANGTDIDAFLEPRPALTRESDISRCSMYESVAMLLRIIRAYLALPGIERRRHALRMMEAMAARAKDLPGGKAV